MRRIVYSPDSVKVFCDIPIRILQEIYFDSIIYLPKAIFGHNSFVAKSIDNDYIKISLLQWSKFQVELIELFNNDNNENIINNIFENLNNLNNVVDDCINKDMITCEDFYALVNGMAFVDSYAVFNMFLAMDGYREKLRDISSQMSVEDIMLCSFEPHRVLIRKKKLEMAIKYGENKSIDFEMAEYFQKYIYYEEFENWLFFPDKYKSTGFLMREIKGLCQKYSISELVEQLSLMNKKRADAINRALQFAEGIPNLEQFLILPAIITEEEKRHMIECKLLFCIGKNLEHLRIDIARSDIKTIARAIKRRQVYGV